MQESGLKPQNTSTELLSIYLLHTNKYRTKNAEMKVIMCRRITSNIRGSNFVKD